MGHLPPLRVVIVHNQDFDPSERDCDPSFASRAGTLPRSGAPSAGGGERTIVHGGAFLTPKACANSSGE